LAIAAHLQKYADGVTALPEVPEAAGAQTQAAGAQTQAAGAQTMTPEA